MDLLLKARFPGGKAKNKLQAEWDRVLGNPPSLSSINRWKAGHMPQSSDDLWRLARMLDVDPTGLIEIEALQMDDIDQFIRTVQLDQWRSHAPLMFLKSFLGRQAVWPPVEYLNKYFDKKRWHSVDFKHDIANGSGFYQQIEIACQSSARHNAVRTYHVAYRQEFLFAGRWLQYGVLIRTPDKVQLVHINGDKQSYVPESNMAPTRFETYFGPGSAIFRVASLHEFDLALVETKDAAKPFVQFG